MTAWDDSALIPKGGPAWKHEHIMKLGSQVQECSAPHLQTLGFSCDVCWANIQSQTVRHARRTWSSWSDMEEGHERRLEQPAGESGSQWVFPRQAQPDRDTPSHWITSGLVVWKLQKLSMDLNGCNENCMFSVMHPTEKDCVIMTLLRKGRCAMIWCVQYARIPVVPHKAVAEVSKIGNL